MPVWGCSRRRIGKQFGSRSKDKITNPVMQKMPAFMGHVSAAMRTKRGKVCWYEKQRPGSRCLLKYLKKYIQELKKITFAKKKTILFPDLVLKWSLTGAGQIQEQRKWYTTMLFFTLSLSVEGTLEKGAKKLFIYAQQFEQFDNCLSCCFQWLLKSKQ